MKEVISKFREEKIGHIAILVSDFRRFVMKIIDKKLLNEVSAQLKESLRLRKNYNFHQSLHEKCHRFLFVVEQGNEVPIHRRPTKEE